MLAEQSHDVELDAAESASSFLVEVGLVAGGLQDFWFVMEASEMLDDAESEALLDDGDERLDDLEKRADHEM